MIKNILTLSCLISTLLTAQIIDPGTLEVKTAKPQISQTIPLGVYLGTYEYPLHNKYTISANTDGFITSINIKPYATVTKGDKLFSLKSPKLLDLQSKYIATILEKEYYDKEVTRLIPLVKKGAVANKKLIESQNNLEKLTASVAFKEDVLLAYGMSKQQLKYINSKHKPDPTLNIYAPASGSIASLNVQSGSFVTQGAVLSLLVNTSECHFEISMNWKEADSLHISQKLFTDTEEFEVFAFAPNIDTLSQTRSIDLHQEGNCNARGGVSRNLAFYRKHQAYRVPDSALINYKGSYTVFVKRDNGFEPIPVKLLGSSEGFSYIDAPLNAVDVLAISSVLTLKTIAQEKDE
ncbi:efflux RND transporter periplasmic adaptor subunit [Sulfurimonas sp.]|uniref:efflux RND transporter periplasmic adaptor subunit n=1 Tax=Sulfurimonas sp. TaxID=2022749 RepID=UPI0026285994|nr:efflux RND transporter periplasmic adaptor subunit [Sulfurimonas sp.]